MAYFAIICQSCDGLQYLILQLRFAQIRLSAAHYLIDGPERRFVR